MDLDQVILQRFLEKWDLDAIRAMRLSGYVDIKNKETFCYWVENETRYLGSINGMPSIKFGIYKRWRGEKRPSNYQNDEQYSWMPGYGSTRAEAFDGIKKDILTIAEASQQGDFDVVDSILLPDLFKWKVAFLYSNNRLVPVFKREVLLRIANHFGMHKRRPKISEIQALMIDNRPPALTVHEFMHDLFRRFGKKSEKSGSGQKKGRRSADGKNTDPQLRQVLGGAYVVLQRHSEIQLALQKRLVKEYGESCVSMEENFVDLKVTLPDRAILYEVKSDSNAGSCIRSALGQVLGYAFSIEKPEKKKIVVVGEYPANSREKALISYLKAALNIEFDYECVVP